MKRKSSTQREQTQHSRPPESDGYGSGRAQRQTAPESSKERKTGGKFSTSIPSAQDPNKILFVSPAETPSPLLTEGTDGKSPFSEENPNELASLDRSHL